MAMLLDTAYQLAVFRAFYVVQALIMAVVCAVVPYVLFRGPATRLARGLAGKRTEISGTLGVNRTHDKGEGESDKEGHAEV